MYPRNWKQRIAQLITNTSDLMTNTATEYHLHLRLVEQGKLYFLEGNYKEALRHYREGLMLCQKEPGADIFFQHYSQCIMEALELSGAYDEVISYCEKTRDFLEDQLENSEHARMYYAALLQREGIQYIKKEDKAMALELMKEAKELSVGTIPPLTASLLNWLQRGFTISAKQLLDTQHLHMYFTVRKETVNPAIAMKLPEMMKTF